MFHKLTAKNCHGFPYMIETVYLRVIGMRCWWSNWGTFENYKISWGDHIDHFIAVYFSFPIPENKLFGTDYTSIYVVLTSLRDIQYSCLRLDIRMLELNQLRNWLNLVVCLLVRWGFSAIWLNLYQCYQA